MQQFRAGVQRNAGSVPITETVQSGLLHSSVVDIADKLGLPKGLIRTDAQTQSITQRYASSLFGDDDDNPARRMRLMREQSAQRAIEKARVVVAARAAANLQASGTGVISDGNSLTTMLNNRFSSGGKR